MSFDEVPDIDLLERMTDFSARPVIEAIKAPTMLIGPDQRVHIQNAAMTELLKIDFTQRNFVTALRQPTIIEAVSEALIDQVSKTARYLIRVDGSDHIFEATAVPRDGYVIVFFEDQTAAEATTTLRRDFVIFQDHKYANDSTFIYQVQYNDH